jgi:hypothetical protein
MQIQRKELKYDLKRCICIGLTLFLFVVIGAGCATPTPPPEQGSHIKIQSGQNSAELSWPK